MQWCDQFLDLQVVHKEELNGSLLGRVLEEINLVVLGACRDAIALF